MRLYWRRNVYGWVMTGLVGKGAKWFFGFSRVPALGVRVDAPDFQRCTYPACPEGSCCADPSRAHGVDLPDGGRDAS